MRETAMSFSIHPKGVSCQISGSALIPVGGCSPGRLPLPQDIARPEAVFLVLWMGTWLIRSMMPDRRGGAEGLPCGTQTQADANHTLFCLTGLGL